MALYKWIIIVIISTIMPSEICTNRSLDIICSESFALVTDDILGQLSVHISSFNPFSPEIKK